MKAKPGARLELDEARALFIYDPVTGRISWSCDWGYRIKRGDEAGTTTTQGYRAITVRGVCYKAHRIAWLIHYGEWPTQQVDHINGVRSDNRLCNLRQASHQENRQNTSTPQKNNRSGYLGVRWKQEEKKWVATISCNRITEHIGYFATAAEAHDAYMERKRVLHPICNL